MPNPQAKPMAQPTAQGGGGGGMLGALEKLPGGGQQQSPMQAAGAGNLSNLADLRTITRNSTPFDFGRFFNGMPPAAQQHFGQNFNILDNLPMHDQLNWFANLFGPNSWTHMINAIGEGRGLEGFRNTTAGTPRSGQTPNQTG